MKKNLDRLVVVLDVDLFWKLVDRAGIGDREIGSNRSDQILKHAARFNPHVAERARGMNEGERAFERETLVLAKKIAVGKQGQTMYFGGGRAIFECQVVGFGLDQSGKKDKRNVRISWTGAAPAFSRETCDVSLYSLADSPGSRVKCLEGKFAGQWVEPVVLQEEEERRRNTIYMSPDGRVLPPEQHAQLWRRDNG